MPTELRDDGGPIESTAEAEMQKVLAAAALLSLLSPVPRQVVQSGGSSSSPDHAKPGLAGYYNADLRGLAREVRQQLRDADRDRDVASATILSRGPVGDVLRSDGAVVVIKGGNYVELFMQWAERNGLLTRGKAIVETGEDSE